jgi:thioredoxin 1
MSRIIILLALIALCLPLALAGENTEVESADSDSADIALSAAKLPTMIDLGSKSCIPCKKMAPILDELREKYKGRAEIIFIDTKENRMAAIEHKITLIPTQIFFDTLGIESYRHVGFFSADSIEAHLFALGVKP